MRRTRLGLVSAASVLAVSVASCAEGSTLSGDADAAGSTGDPSGSGGAGGTSGSMSTSGSTSTGAGAATGCPEDDHEPAESCAAAKPMGQVTDASATALEISGTLTDATDEDWYAFETLDSDEATTNSYHVKIEFSAPAGLNDEFSFDVIRGDTCGAGDARHSDLKTYDWCVDGTGTVGATPIGEGLCGTPTAPCSNHSRGYLLRVHRDPQYAYSSGTCVAYALSITARGTGQCDFTGNCDLQVTEGSP